MTIGLASFQTQNRTKTKVVPRLRGALLRSSAMSSKQGGGRGEERGRVYPDKEAAVERLLQPPGYMRGRPRLRDNLEHLRS